jgi:formylglycine-generating enzyme required for sulfatase activity
MPGHCNFQIISVFVLSAMLALALAGCGKSSGVSTRLCLKSASIGQHVLISGGAVERGANKLNPEERVGGQGAVQAFTIDNTEVTNAEYAAFVAATHYVTLAERINSNGHRIGAAVFRTATGTWRIDPTADWRHPAGAGSSIAGHETEPVVDVAFEDAQTYAAWLHRRLPTELEWEFAARGGRPAPARPDSEAVAPDGRYLANAWQGPFPIQDSGADGFKGVAPAGCFPSNTNGLYDMIGNVWEWTRDWAAAYNTIDPQRNPQGPAAGLRKIRRGGAWSDDLRGIIPAWRDWSRADTPYYTDVGFRCARAVE